MNIYQENILDHHRNPRNFGRLARPTHAVDHTNPLCGDALHLELLVENGAIIEIAFDGQGCAISLAAASIMTEQLKGQPVEVITGYSDQRMQDELGVPLSPARLKCGLLAVSALRKCLQASGRRPRD